MEAVSYAETSKTYSRLYGITAQKRVGLLFVKLFIL
jgi:hypothetical protein